MFIAALFGIAKNWRPPPCPPLELASHGKPRNHQKGRTVAPRNHLGEYPEYMLRKPNPKWLHVIQPHLHILEMTKLER